MNNLLGDSSHFGNITNQIVLSLSLLGKTKQ